MPCAQHCGLEVLVEKNRIVKVRPDKDNPRSQGYVCRKGLNVSYHQHHKQRLTHPLKRTDRGFTVISWDQAIDEISHKLRSIIDQHGPRALAYMGAGARVVILRRPLASGFYKGLAPATITAHWPKSSPAPTGCGDGLPGGCICLPPDHEQTDMLLTIGWNGMMSHQMPQARPMRRHSSSWIFWSRWSLP